MKKNVYLVIAFFILLLWLFPLIWMVLTSLNLEKNVISSSFHFFPDSPTLANYIKAFSSTYIMKWLINSTIVSFATMFFTLIVDAPIAYALARIRFPFRQLMFWVIMVGMMIPFQVLIIPLYIQFNSYGIINTLSAAVLPRLALPIGVFILKQFFEGIPGELEEAAFIDGSSRWKNFLHIILPLGKSAMATVMILSFIQAWNDFLWPLIVISDSPRYTITVGIANFQGVHGTEYALIMSGALIASIPQFVFYFIFRKKIVEGIAMTGIKG